MTKGNVGSKLLFTPPEESVRRISQLGRVIRIGLYGTLDLEGLVEQRENGDTGTSYGGMTCTVGRMDRTSLLGKPLARDELPSIP